MLVRNLYIYFSLPPYHQKEPSTRFFIHNLITFYILFIFQLTLEAKIFVASCREELITFANCFSLQGLTISVCTPELTTIIVNPKCASVQAGVQPGFSIRNCSQVSVWLNIHND